MICLDPFASVTLKPKTVTQMGLFSGGPWGLATLLALSEWAAVVMSRRRLLSVLGEEEEEGQSVLSTKPLCLRVQK